MMLKNEYIHLRKSDGKQSTSYRYTVRQLESLIRLSEAMARVHADTKIRPAYVREVCRLLKASNINILKNDLEFNENQEFINVERENYADEIKQDINDLFVSESLNKKRLTNFYRRWKSARKTKTARMLPNFKPCHSSKRIKRLRLRSKSTRKSRL